MPTLTIPESIRSLLADRAIKESTSVEDLAIRLLEAELAPALGGLLDRDYHAECSTESNDVPSLAEVRAILAKLPGSLAESIIADRDER
ncbi:MAG TPA: hypothetical protein VN641_05810 [Urbifossiella sp.]|nr:hypothetical protein [Urbifossiella sp.]